MGLEMNSDIDVNKLRKINFVYPGFIKHPVVASDVRMTKDGRFVLTYYEIKKNVLFLDYTEIVNSNGEWGRYPFKKSYDSYEFLEYDKDFSNHIVEELPQDLKFKVFVRKGSKEGNAHVINNERAYNDVLDQTGSEVVNDDDNVRYLYMVLLATEGDKYLVKQEDDLYYKFDFPFPIFSLPYEIYHEPNKNDSNLDENYNVGYTQEEHEREDLPVSMRRLIKQFLEEQEGNKIDITGLPILEIPNDETGERIRICFVSCPNLALFSDVYKADSLSVDKDVEKNSFDNTLESALHYERPLIIGFKNKEMKTNGVRHNLNNSINK